ncbi:MAG: hypothetical protein KGI50_07785, partial [Patescibacteria group bacterium]|nr:hypothetical protein [Patescibacteria group bacterium]
VDKAPENLKGEQRNEWALNPSHKKPNALDLGYPKLKAECVKNAAQSLGKIFGRDINRKKADTFKPAFKSLTVEGFKSLVKRLESGDNAAKLIAQAETYFILEPEQKEILEGFKPKLLQNGSI